MTYRRPLPGRRVIVGSSQIHLRHCGTDTGAPTVILEAGLGGCSTSWTRVIALLAPYTRIVAYDRAGHGRSTNPHAGGPRTPADVADRLRQALAAAEITGPYVVVGHSVGAVYSRAFAARYPESTAGLVLVDPTLPPRPAVTGPAGRWMLPLLQPLTCAAISRLTGNRPPAGVTHDGGAYRRAGERSEWVQAKTWQAMFHELRGLAHTDQPADPPAAHTPVVVITQAPPATTDGPAATAWRRLAAEHSRLAGPAPLGRHVYADYAGHPIPDHEPGLVADTVLRLLSPDRPWKTTRFGPQRRDVALGVVTHPLITAASVLADVPAG